ncbi:MAG TPA: dual specificity protein phosphatase [Herpetosiphonaceae bacterium]
MRIPHSAFRTRSRIFARFRRWQRQSRPDLPPNADAVTPQLVVGGFIDRDDWRQLVEQGVSVVVSLQAERHDEDAFGEIQPDGYLRLPTIDHSIPTLAQLRMGAAFIDEAVRAGKMVLIHCHAGVGRSALLCACYLVYTGMSVEEAWQTVKAKRTVAFLNSRQQTMLEQFAATIERERAATSVPVTGPPVDAEVIGEQLAGDAA